MFCLLQAALIIGLLVNRARRRQGEAEATLIADISSKFVNLPSGEVDGEIVDAERRICELLGLDFAALWQWSDETPGVLTPTHVYRRKVCRLPGRCARSSTPGMSRRCWLAAQSSCLRWMSCRRRQRRPGNLPPFGHQIESDPPALGGGQAARRHPGPQCPAEGTQLAGPAGETAANGRADFRQCPGAQAADQALRKSEELNRATFEQAAVGIAHVGTDGRWLRVNDRLCAIVGYPRDELMKLTFQDITHPEDLETDLNFVRQILSGEIKSHSMEKRYIRKDRSTVWVILTVSLVRTASGAPLHFISVVEDITEQRRAETEAQELRGNLAHAGRVTLLGQLASALAHELSQPLGAILRNAEAAEIMLQASSPDLEELRAIVTDIRGDDQRAGQVIDRLRSLLKRRSLDPQPIELQSVVAEVFSLVRADAAARRLKLDYSPAPVLPMVRGDRIHLQQVLLNLLLNAMDALDGCAPEPALHPGERSPDGSRHRRSPGLRQRSGDTRRISRTIV